MSTSQATVQQPTSTSNQPSEAGPSGTSTKDGSERDASAGDKESEDESLSRKVQTYTYH